MFAGKTKIEVGTRIRTTKKWDNTIVTGTITHPFACFGGNPIAGIRIDREYLTEFADIGNLYKGDFKVMR